MELPNDLILETFSWLPAKAIYKLRYANKFFWKSSSETYFAMKQAQHSMLKGDSCFFLQCYTSKIEFHPLPSENLSSCVSDTFLQLSANSSVKILASSNGLVLCCSKKYDEIELFICNPATQSWLSIPTPDYLQKYPNLPNITFECNCESLDPNDFVIFLFEAPTEWSTISYYDCEFYSPKEEGIWKKMEKSFFTGARDMRFDMQVYHNGALHFISTCYPSFTKDSPYFRPYIMAYNLKDGESRMLRVPKEARRGSHDSTCELSIFKWEKVMSSDQSICLVRLKKSIFTIWVLTNYECSKWRKILKIRVKAMGIMEKGFKVTGFTVMNGDCLIFSTQKSVYSYGLSQKNYKILDKIYEHEFVDSPVSFTPYSNTLRPCENGATTLA